MINTLNEAHETLWPFFFMKENEIFEKFQKLSNKSIFVDAKQSKYKSIFIPGTREDRVLLVAHVDMYHGDYSPKFKLEFDDNKHFMYYTNSQRRGIGADDRAGVAACWHLRKLGHSIILTAGEERGCLGSNYFMSNEELAKMIQDTHQFAIQFDRNGRNDLVYYNVGTKEFAEYTVEQTGYKPANGTFTDICLLCEKICGVNISIGYKHEHTSEELLNLRHWSRTVNTCYKWLSEENLPKFIH